ncbi:MAG: hypothetical protein R2932_49230 [Caldilineaceae bacterium]
MFASGQRFHHAATCLGSLLASNTPWRVRMFAYVIAPDITTRAADHTGPVCDGRMTWEHVPAAFCIIERSVNHGGAHNDTPDNARIAGANLLAMRA